MTLVIAAPSNDFLVLGADSRGTTIDAAGNRMELNTLIKLVKVTDTTGILMYGAANEANYIIDKFKTTIKNQKENVSTTAQKFADFCREEARLTSDIPTIHFPVYGFIVAGLNKTGKTYAPLCYSLKSSSGFRLGLYPQKFGIEGKPLIAQYLFGKHYQPQMNLDDLLGLVAKALHETKSIDGDVGGEIRLAIINQDGMRYITKRDIPTYISKFDNLSMVKEPIEEPTKPDLTSPTTQLQTLQNPKKSHK